MPRRGSVLVLAGSLVLGCAMPGGVVRMPATHHVDADRELVRGDVVQGRARKLCGIFLVVWGAPDGAMMDRAMADALRKSRGAELLVDAQSDASIYWLPLVFARCRVNVTGTAASTKGRDVAR